MQGWAVQVAMVLLCLLRSEAWVTPIRPTRTVTPSTTQLLHQQSDNKVSWDHALAVIPPDEAWDRIQRARHIAKDQSYAVWPPSIRLFHPFVPTSDVAFDIAHVIEKYDIEPFAITLSEWSIVPHQEALEGYWQAMNELQVGGKLSSEDDRVAQLIDYEEQVGKQKRRERRHQKVRKLRMKHLEQGGAPDDVVIPESLLNEPQPESYSHFETRSEKMRQQAEMYEEFNGPCVIVLEPDEESKVKLERLHYLLCKELSDSNHYAPHYSPSGSVAPHTVHVPVSENAPYRPVVPIAALSTVSNAIVIARELRKLWEPLTFNVTDLHVIGCTGGEGLDEEEDDNEVLLREHRKRQPNNQNDVSDEEKLKNNMPFGCDALISLMGTEIPNDLDDETRQLVEELGEPGGYGTNGEPSEYEMFDAEDSNLPFDLEQYLLEDEDFDEGTVVVINRVQFFTGGMREYVGMPACSALDARDRTLGDNFVSGAARRRAPVHRQGMLYEDGEWGRKDVDYAPWGKSERRRRGRPNTERLFDDLD